MTTSNLENNITIIYKTYTPQRKEYAKKYYQLNKEILQTKQREYYNNKKEEMKQDPNYKEKIKLSHEKYINKLKENPEKYEIYKQKRRDYYKNKKQKTQ